jgi:hypothetical protein
MIVVKIEPTQHWTLIKNFSNVISPSIINSITREIEISQCWSLI